MGKVFAAVNKTTGKRVAMKFFGYTERAPSFADMEKEIQLLISLKGIDGIVQLEGVFLDTVNGMLPGKRHRGEFPVIVMEMIEGGELFDRINNRSTVSERDLAKVFRHIIIAMQSLHERRFIHRDLKLENLMLVNNEEDSKIKLIDFGMMVRVMPPHEVYTSGRLQGTAGYYAPESINHQEYSYKTDIWQAGCILYCMLSGLPPFNPRYPKQITHYSYIPMTGEGWDSISAIAKDLVARILNKDKNERLTCEQILNHPWMQGHAPSTNLGTDYFTRIKHLVLRQKFKAFFLENNIAEDNKSRRSELEKMLPFLHERLDSGWDSDEKEMEPKRSRSDSNAEKLKFREKLGVLRAFMIQAVISQKKAATSPTVAAEVESAPSGMSSEEAEKSAAVAGEIDYPTFVSMLERAELPELATPAVFNIFDIGKSRTIDLKEFLTTMLAFRPESADTDAARLYFNIFDIGDTGYIEKEELRVCLELLLLDDTARIQGSSGGMPHVEELFSTMDFTKTGRIDFDEFKTFYNAVLTSTTNTRSLAVDQISHAEPPAIPPTVIEEEEVIEEVTTSEATKADAKNGEEAKEPDGVVMRCMSCNII